jgi:hypothetical protein
MTADNHVEFHVHLSNAETEATTWSMADTDRIVSQLAREMSGITSNKHMQFQNKPSIGLIKFKAWRKAISVQ